MDVVDVWTGRQATALRAALRMTNESFATHLGAGLRTVAYWDAKPAVVMTPALQEVLDAALEQASPSAKRRFALLCSADGNGSSAAGRSDDTMNGVEEFSNSARESASDAALRAARVSDAVDATKAQLITAARRYSYSSPVGVFTDARQVRNVAYQLAERTRRPSELADLYVLAGAANAIMSSIAFDLGHWDAAQTLVAAGTTYANLAGHASLEAWTWGLQATLANWRRDPLAATAAFDRGMAVAPKGAPRVRLRHIAARTQSTIGNHAAAETLLRQAHSDREDAKGLRDELEHELGGEFAFGDARAAACAAAAWLELRHSERAEAAANGALHLYEQMNEQARPFSPINGLRLDISTARLLRRDLDGAQDVLKPVLDLEPTKRNTALVGRVAAVRAELVTPGWQRARTATDLIGDLDHWSAHTAAAHPPAADIS